jgi:hypothetical protein
MRHYGGGIGHLNNTLPQQADPLDYNSDEMDLEEHEEEDAGSDARDGPQDVVMNGGELEVDNDDDGDDSDNYDYDENDGGDEDGDEGEGEDDEEDDYGYASP